MDNRQIDRQSLREVVRCTISLLDASDENTAAQAVGKLRLMYASELGLPPRVHEGRRDMDENETIEWFAGQILDVVDSRAWFAVNSLINCCDKFCPEK